MADFAEGAPCWADATLPDLAAGRRFYGELFGWTFPEEQPADPDGWTPALLDGEQVAGLRQKSDGRMPTVWTVYLATADARRTAARIDAAGGRVITTPVPVGRGPAGITATAADPSGAVFGLWQPGEHPGFATVDRPGAYVWTEVRTRERDAVDAFYPEVFGYGTRQAEAAGEDFLMWAPEGEPADEEHAVGGRALLDEATPVELPAYFLTYFAVDDCDEAVHTVVRLGGRVLSGPETGGYGRYAVLVDNQGAVFAVLDTGRTAPPAPAATPARAREETAAEDTKENAENTAANAAENTPENAAEHAAENPPEDGTEDGTEGAAEGRQEEEHGGGGRAPGGDEAGPDSGRAVSEG